MKNRVNMHFKFKINDPWIWWVCEYTRAHLFRSGFDTHTATYSNIKISNNKGKLLLSAYYTPGDCLKWFAEIVQCTSSR